MSAVQPPGGHSVDILLGSFNGEAFLGAQLQSIEAQSFSQWRLIARDDASSDGTVALLEDFRARHPGRVQLLRDDDGRLGAVANFGRLLQHSDAPYAAFCDQDDVWMADKLALGLECMGALEARHGSERPLLVFSDLEVVDRHLETVAASLWCRKQLRPERSRELGALLVDNVVTGCTTLMNHELVRQASPIPEGVLFHDWWVALVAAALGRSAWIERATVRYRQHGYNAAGAGALHLRRVPELLYRAAFDAPAVRAKIRTQFEQMRVFAERYRDQLDDGQRRLIERLLTIPDSKLFGRAVTYARCRALPNSPLHALGLVVMSGDGR